MAHGFGYGYGLLQGGTPFSPGDVDDLELWLDAEVGVSTDVDGVNNWADQSPKSNDVVQATGSKKPALVTDVVNGKSVVRFDQVDDTLAKTLGTPLEQPGLIFMVWSPARLSGGKAIFSGNASGRWQVNVAAGAPDDVWQIYAGSTLNVGGDTVPPVVGTFRYNLFTYDGASSEVRANGIKQGSSGQTGAESCDMFSLGGFNDNGFQLGGDIAEVGVYSSIPSQTERNNLEAYMKNKFGL